MTASTLRIDRRFRGPPASGNGGYVCGMLARGIGGSGCTITLRQPPPLERDLTIALAEGEVRLLAEDALIAVGSRQEETFDVPAPPSLEEAREAQANFTGFHHHIFPGCFVCGPDREAGDGLRIFPGRASIAEQVASVWTPDTSLGDEAGKVKPEFLWAALDCPGYFAVQDKAGAAVLGRLHGLLHRDVSVGEPLIVTGWANGSSGRKHMAGTALHDRGGALVAAGLATWISIQLDDGGMPARPASRE